MDIVIKVEHLSKQYRLGDIGTGTMRHDLNRWWYLVRGKDDPYLKIGEKNQRTVKSDSDYVWALDNINFEIKQGAAVGIIGRNGAGKSTLLKILSRTTSPSKGTIKIKGKIASLLEVGTGFHPELSGRENIFLNGAILGMTKSEIRSKFDEIVHFAGVDRYIDTPVKRYSSGMYVRLAFGVAAHLEPDILIVDEVLAVGDAEFQKKALGKMEDVSAKDGRTVLFVSHNMSSVKQLCNSLILMQDGGISYKGDVSEGIKKYLENLNIKDESFIHFEKSGDAYVSSIRILDQSGSAGNSISYNEDFNIAVEFLLRRDIENIELSLCLKNSNAVNVFFTSLSETNNNQLMSLKAGKYVANVNIKGYFLIPDTYYLSTYLHLRNNKNFDHNDDAIKINIIETGSSMAPYGPAATNFACVFANAQWEIKSFQAQQS